MSQAPGTIIHSVAELRDAAIEISRILREAKVDAPLRPKALAAILVAHANASRDGQDWLGGGAASRSTRGPAEQSEASAVSVPTRANAAHIGIPENQSGSFARRFAPSLRMTRRGILPEASNPLAGAAAKPVLSAINDRVRAALATHKFAEVHRRRLEVALRLTPAEFDRLTPFVGRIGEVLGRLDLPSTLDGDLDALGVFYEAFLRYGYDNNALGIVFTPRHLTRFCVELIGVAPTDRVIDIACGTGGFLVAAHAQMQNARRVKAGHGADGAQREPLLVNKHTGTGAICGFDTNPTVWALAVLNLWFRHADTQGIALGSCFDRSRRGAVRKQFTRAFLNPPFSQTGEPERDFIDASMEALVPSGRCAVVVKAGLFADEEHRPWREAFLRRHTLLAVISLPEDVFYPTAVPSSILLAEAHRPQSSSAAVLMARIWNDGFEKLKNQRVERPEGPTRANSARVGSPGGSELPEVKRCFDALLRGEPFHSPLAIPVCGEQLADGVEWSPQEWLPQPAAGESDLRLEQRRVAESIFRAVAEMPELAETALPGFAANWECMPPLPLGEQSALNTFFSVLNGNSSGEKHYPDGEVAYISSGGASNSIVRLVAAGPDELFANGGITVTAFGQTAVQPWPFLARGNGGSSVRVLLPRFRMGFAELAWFAAQINMQRWRFFYARMAIKSRLERLVVSSPSHPLPQVTGAALAARIRTWREKLAEFSEL